MVQEFGIINMNSFYRQFLGISGKSSGNFIKLWEDLPELDYLLFLLELSLNNHNTKRIPPPYNNSFPKPLPLPQTPQFPPLLQYLQELQVVQARQLSEPVQRPARTVFVERIKIIKVV